MGEIKAKTQLQQLGFKDPDRKNSKHDTIQIWVYENIHEVLAQTIMRNNPHPFKILKNEWEHTVVNERRYSKYIVGYVDLMIEIEGKFFDSSSETYSEERMRILIEVKTSIPVLGDLIRQMRAYQEFQTSYWNNYLIVAPDDRFRKILAKQGFYFYKYKDPTLLF